jgi:hypothetical protein
MKTEQILSQTVAAFNQRRFAEAAAHAERGSLEAAGRDELFWIGLTEICRGYALLMDRKLEPAEAKLVSAMEKLRHFGYRYQNFEVWRAFVGAWKRFVRSSSGERRYSM